MNLRTLSLTLTLTLTVTLLEGDGQNESSEEEDFFNVRERILSVYDKVFCLPYLQL
jgi:hypothetical protein